MSKHNIIHRDVKSANIFIHIPGKEYLDDSEPIDEEDLKRADFKLADMNISTLTGKNEMRTTMNGTPYFASPEMLSHKPYDHK